MSRRISRLIQRVQEIRGSISKRYRRDCDIPLDVFLEKSRRALLLLDFIEKSNIDKELKLEARKNFIINCVTALEVFLKDMLFALIPLNKEKACNLRSLLKDEKISILEAYELFVKEEVTLEEYVTAKFSLQNLENINKIFSTFLYGKDKGFLDKIDEFSFEEPKSEEEKKPEEKDRERFILKDRHPDWREALAELFRLRHSYIHQIRFRDRLGIKKLRKLWNVLYDFVRVVDCFLLQYIPRSKIITD